jgi:drug/metabolite transporter (DMT)-like permease
MKKALPYAAATVSAITWGFSFLFTKNALYYLDTFQLLGYRFLVAAVLLAVLAAVGAIKLRLTAAKLKGMLLVALLQPVLYFVGETFGVKLTSATETGIIIALVPIAVSIFSFFMLKERMSPVKWIATAICVLGVVLIVLARGYHSGSGQMAGVLALLGAVVAAGIYTPLSRMVSRQSTPMEITFVMICVGAIVFNGIGIVSEATASAAAGRPFAYFNEFVNPAVITGIAYLGILSSVVAFFCLNFALSKLESSVIGTFINLTPLITVIAGITIGGESLLPLQCAGAALILAGIWGAARRTARKASMPLPADAGSSIMNQE